MLAYKVTRWLKFSAILFFISLIICVLYLSLNAPRSARRNIYRRAAPLHPRADELDERLLLQQYLNSHNNGSSLGARSCVPYPRFEDIKFYSKHYQVARSGAVTFYMFGAYYDRRLSLEHAPRVVVLVMSSAIEPPFPATYCQIWYEGDSEPVITPVIDFNVVWYAAWGNGHGYNYPTLLSCELHRQRLGERVPALVSLVFQQDCARASNALRVVYNAPVRTRARRFGVCVKDLRFEDRDVSTRFVEWLELLRLLGAEHVSAYDGKLTSNTRRTLQHYAGYFELRPFSMLLTSGQQPDGLNTRLNEVLVYNDCIYRNLYQFDYVGVFDVDEVIMPLGELYNWTALMQQLESMTNLTHNSDCNIFTSYCFRNVYYPSYPEEPPIYDALPTHFYMLQHVERVAEHLDANLATKCLHSMAYVRSMHNHFPLSWMAACAPANVPTDLGQLQHYREPDIKETLLTPVLDDNIWRFKQSLVKNVNAVYKQLGWSPQN